jgi:hypothetical protein
MEVVNKIDKFIDSKETIYTYKTLGNGEYRTKESLEKRSLKNIPKYSNGKSRIRFQDWLHIKTEKDSFFGKSEADGKWYGWSHRAIYGFGVGDEVKGDSSGKKVTYDKLPNGDLDWDNGKYEPDFIIKNDKQAREVAITFAKNVG